MLLINLFHGEDAHGSHGGEGVSRVGWLVVPHLPPRLKKLSPRNLYVVPWSNTTSVAGGGDGLALQTGRRCSSGWVGGGGTLLLLLLGRGPLCPPWRLPFNPRPVRPILLPTIDWWASQHRQPASVGCELRLPTSDGEGGGQGADCWSEGGR